MVGLYLLPVTYFSTSMYTPFHYTSNGNNEGYKSNLWYRI